MSGDSAFGSKGEGSCPVVVITGALSVDMAVTGDSDNDSITTEAVGTGTVTGNGE